MRRSDGLFAWTGHAGDDAGPVLRCLPLPALPASLLAARDALLADWESLRSARDLASVWPAFWRIFWATLTESRERSSIAIPTQVCAPALPPATAAHPRAFRGTRFTPPKPALPALDLCTWLSEDRLLDAFFARHDFQRLPALDRHGKPLAAGTHTVSDLLTREYGPWPALPDAFRRHILWRLRERAQGDLMAWLRVWRALDGAPERQALAALLCARSPDSHAWASRALQLRPARQRLFLGAFLAHRTDELSPDQLSEEQVAELSDLVEDDARFSVYLDAVLSNLRRQVSASYSLTGCALGNQLNSDNVEWLRSQLNVHADCHDVPLRDIQRMETALNNDGRGWRIWAWSYCGALPGFAHILRDTCWEKLSVNAVYQWLDTFSQMQWEYEGAALTTRWRALLAAFPEWHRALLTVPEGYQYKFTRILCDHARRWEDMSTFAQCIPCLLPTQLRLCRPPFAANVDGTALLFPMAKHLSTKGWQQLAACDDRNWLIAEQACRRDNDAILIGRGLYSLTSAWPDFAVNAFEQVPRRLMRTARLLGCLSHERRRQILARASRDGWFSTNWQTMPELDACRAILQRCRDTGINSPLPRRLREHLEGTIDLSPQQIARHSKLALTRLAGVLLEALEQLIWASIDAPFNLRAQSTAANHAVRMLAGLDTNRKGLRRFLLAYCQGRADSYLDHPLNRAWFERHPRIAAGLWNPRSAAGQDGADGDISIAIETDPLEILMLGTYVGSCLGLGGLCDYSAVACLLDANKQVIYARDKAGRILARQLIAIDESDRLVCFEVYPVTAGEALRRALQAHNAALAQRLGIAIFLNPKEDIYEIPVILAESWWDDGAIGAPAD